MIVACLWISGQPATLAAEAAARPVPAIALLDSGAAAGGATDRLELLCLRRIFTTLGIPAESVAAAGFADRAAHDAALASRIDAYDPALVVCAGYMRIFTPAFVARYADRMLNIHPSLLPEFRGLHTHRRALAAGIRWHGCSVHFVTDELDGGPLVAQAPVPVLPGDTEDSLAARVHRAEHKLYPTVIGWYATARLRCRAGQVTFDGVPLARPIRLEHLDVDP